MMNANTVHDSPCMQIAMSFNGTTTTAFEMASSASTRRARESFPSADFFGSPTTRRSSTLKSDLQKTLAILDEVLTLLEDSDDLLHQDSQ